MAVGMRTDAEFPHFLTITRMAAPILLIHCRYIQAYQWRVNIVDTIAAITVRRSSIKPQATSHMPFDHNLSEGKAITVQRGDLSGEPLPAFHSHIDVGRIEFNPKSDPPGGFRRDQDGA